MTDAGKSTMNESMYFLLKMGTFPPEMSPPPIESIENNNYQIEKNIIPKILPHP